MFIYNTPKSNFTIIPNEVIENENISVQALAIYVKLRRNSATWNLNMKAFAKKCGLNIATFYKYLKELYNEGLIKRVQTKDDQGRYTKEVAYIFTDSIEITEAEMAIENLEKEKLKELERELENSFKNAELESTKTEVLKIDTLNNIIESNKTKESISPKKFVLIDLKRLWQQCKETIQKDKAIKQTRKEQEQNELFNFKSQLTTTNANAYDTYIAYRSERKKLSKATLKRIQNKFLQLQNDGQDLSLVVENSILKGWTDLYPIQSKAQRQKQENIKQSKEYKSFTERYKDFDYEKELAKVLAL